MENPQAVGGYRLDVTNFGPIVRASVDLRPLTVFIGPSNTGKSYLAILIYALHLGFGGTTDILSYRRGIPRRLGWPVRSVRPRASIRKSLRDWLSKVEEDSVPVLPTDIAEHIRSILEQANGFGRHLEREIRRCFGVDRLDELARRPGGRIAAIDINVPQNGTEMVRYQVGIDQEDIHLSGQLSKGLSSATEVLNEAITERVKRYWAGVGIENIEEGDIDRVFRTLVRATFATWLRPVCRSAYYLPADRTGVMHSHQVVFSALAQNATRAGLEPGEPIPILSGVLVDFLSQLIGMSDRRHSLRRVSRSEIHLERNILGGSVRLDPAETGYPIFAYRPHGWKEDLPLMRVSSMVSELAPVALYLRSLVQSGDVLIIEEPEAHLHPAMQAAFAGEIARLVRSGIRVVMTTHSEWFLEKIGNLVRLSELPEKKRTRIEREGVALSPHEVGAWLFKPSKRPKGSIVEEVKLDSETGLFPTDYGEVSEALYNEGAQIFNRLQEGDEE